MILRRSTIDLRPRPRGFHLVSDEIRAGLDLAGITAGLCHLLLQHTSASLTLNENADPDVRGDLERWLDRVAPERAPSFEHVLEGADDMPAHIKCSLLGVSQLLPVTAGRLDLGTWQGLWLGEHRDRGGRRRVVATAWGV